MLGRVYCRESEYCGGDDGFKGCDKNMAKRCKRGAASSLIEEDPNCTREVFHIERQSAWMDFKSASINDSMKGLAMNAEL